MSALVVRILTLTGSGSRDLLQRLADKDLSNEAFAWLSVQAGEVGYAPDVRLIRVSYAGELGWEIHHPVSCNRHLTDLLIWTGEPHGLKPFRFEALESMRMEKSYRARRRELRPDITALEASMERFGPRRTGRLSPGYGSATRAGTCLRSCPRCRSREHGRWCGASASTCSHGKL